MRFFPTESTERQAFPYIDRRLSYRLSCDLNMRKTHDAQNIKHMHKTQNTFNEVVNQIQYCSWMHL